MPLNDTDTERRRQAADDLANKLRLERRITIELRELFREMGGDLQASVELTGGAQRADLYIDDFKGILSRHARRVSTAFGNHVVDFLEESINNEKEDTIANLTLISAASGIVLLDIINGLRNTVRENVQSFNAEQVRLDTALITATNQKQLDESVAKASEEIQEETGQQPSRIAIAALATREFLRKAFIRVKTIAITTTQKIAESTKDIERQAFFNIRNGFQAVAAGIPQAQEIETWITQGDDKVRRDGFNHVAADGQRKENGVFIVSGEELRFPGDPNGSAGNIIRCRCSSVVTLE